MATHCGCVIVQIFTSIFEQCAWLSWLVHSRWSIKQRLRRYEMKRRVCVFISSRLKCCFVLYVLLYLPPSPNILTSDSLHYNYCPPVSTLHCFVNIARNVWKVVTLNTTESWPSWFWLMTKAWEKWQKKKKNTGRRTNFILFRKTYYLK